MPNGQTAPLANSNILLIRHAEKPDEGSNLSPAGQARADAYVEYFRNLDLGGSIRIDHIFAATNSLSSSRPSLTVAPTAEALGFTVDTTFKDKEYAALAGQLLGHPKYANSNILICWHHEHLLLLAASLGVDAGSLPSSSAWPARWPGEVFGWLIKIGYDDQGRVDPARTVCGTEHLMEDDLRDPPG